MKRSHGGCLDRLEVRRSDVHGLGVFATEDIAARRKIGEYTGRRHDLEKMDNAWNDQLTYLFALSDGSVIDGADGGNATRHINHSCTPNVEAVERERANGEFFITIRALRLLRLGDELLLNYSLVIDGNDFASYSCACASARCRGTMAGAAFAA